MQFNLRSQINFTAGPISSANTGQKSLRYLGPKICNIMPTDSRNSGNIEECTRKIKSQIPNNCSCKLCLNYIHHVGYVNQPYFWNQPFKSPLANRNIAYFGRGYHDGCFCIDILLTLNCKKKICFVIVIFTLLIHLLPTHPFSIPWKHQKTLLFLMFPGDRKKVPREEFKILNQLKCKYSIFGNMT